VINNPCPKQLGERTTFASIAYARDLHLRLVMYWFWLLLLLSFAVHFLLFHLHGYDQDYKGLVMQNPSPW